MKKKVNNIGIKVDTLPKVSCEDKNCPYHGKSRIHGRVFSGEVIKEGSHNTIKVGWQRLFYIPKYQRYEKRRTRINAHVPKCLEIKKGDFVRIAETRPISKSKNFIVIEVIKK